MNTIPRDSRGGTGTTPLACARASADRLLAELIRFVRFPSVSAQPRHAEDVKRCAAWLAQHLQSIGLENVTVTPTARHPIVYADWRHARGQPTVLIYGHYDVQPADPLSEWRSPPFDPVVRGEDLFGRGASDDKGQLFAHVKAVECMFQELLGIPTVLMGFALPDDSLHGPNEKFHLPVFHKAIRTSIAFLRELARHEAPSVSAPKRTAFALAGADI